MGNTEELRWTAAAAKLINVTKYAVDAAVNESLKGGIQVYEIVKGKVKGRQTPSHVSNDYYKKQNAVLVEEMQARLEKMQDDVYKLQHQQGMVSTCTTEEQENLKQFSDEPLKSSAPEFTNPIKIFIRSRL